MDKNTKSIIRRILSDIRVELGDEFDRNFERQAFFNDVWARRKSPTYAAIHNDGGEIVVTEKMKRFFWHKYYEATGSFGRKKNGERRNDKRTRQLSTEADFWRFMALKRAGTTIRIPRRRFLGTGPEVERIVREIIEENLNDYFDMDFSIERK